MTYTSDPIVDEIRRTLEWAERKETLPICDVCCDPIEDDYLYEIGDTIFCQKCVDKCRQSVEVYLVMRGYLEP